MTGEPFTLTITGADADFLRTFQRRIGEDVGDYLFENIWEDYGKRARCMWDGEFRTAEYCSDCDYREGCRDKVQL
jgi:MoaA/NifB/PqqE/SkfB family radical SAM enzyme